MRCVAFLTAFVLAMLAQDNRNLDVIRLNGQDCGLKGTARSAAGKALNHDKNRYQLPTEDDFDGQVSLAAMAAPGFDRSRFDHGKAARITAYVIDVTVGGNHETCNCGATDDTERDTHFQLGLAPDVPDTQQVIAEVTPRMRLLMKDQGKDWTTPTLHDQFKGKWVEIRGWLMFDTMHIRQAENTNPGNPENWRATCWEIHPITSITLVDEPSEAASFRATSFRALQGMHAHHVGRSPNAKAALDKLHQEELSKFDASELEETKEENEMHWHRH